MSLAPRQLVYVDTMIVLEAARTNCLAAILNHFDFHTADVVLKEILDGDFRKRDFVRIDASSIRKITAHEVPPTMLASARLKVPRMATLHKGEEALLAYLAAANPSGILLSSADRAAVQVACLLGFQHRLRALEEIAGKAGMNPQIRDWFKKRWLGEVITKHLMDHL